MKTLLAPLAALTFVVWPGYALANESAPQVLVETDPVTFAMSGYSAHVRVPLPGSGWTVGAGLYGMNLPDFVPDLHPDNADGNFHLELDKSYGAFLDYHFSGRPEGWFVGLQTALQRHRVTRADDPSATEVGVLLVMPRVGYLLRPIDDSGFYLLPWAGAGPAIELYRTNDAMDGYHSLPLLAFGTLHVGWAF